MTQSVIPTTPGTVFHVPWEMCDEWLIVNPTLALCVLPNGEDTDDGYVPVVIRAPAEFAHSFSGLHLPEECSEFDRYEHDWEFS